MEGKVLLIEDSKLVQQMYKNKLLIEKFEVITADNGMDGIKSLTSHVPDILLLDLMMPVMDGYKVLHVLKTDAKLKNIPVIIFSAKGQPEEIEKALHLGATDFIIKATTKPDQVVERIRKVLSESKKSKDIPHYDVQFDIAALDAQKLSSDLGLNNFVCMTCGSPLILNVIPEHSMGKSWIAGKFTCPKCREV
jgi:DNA-binding response OmpR family regulator